MGGDTAPSLATGPCEYGPATTSASLTTAGALAHADVVFKSSVAASAAYPGYLFMATGDTTYRDFFDANYTASTFNGNWPLDSWQVTEPDDGYQAKYIRLPSKLVQ